MNVLRLAVRFVVLGLLLPLAANAQTACPPLTIPPVVQGKNIFSPQQQIYLGDAIDASLRLDIAAMTDPAVTGRLQAIVDHLAQALPSPRPTFQVALVDIPSPNAYSTVGGRIYVGRKLVAQARSEDELAGVLAHEMGHLVAEQLAIEISGGFQTVLAVTQVTTQKDVTDKWNELLSNWRRVHVSESDVHRAEKTSRAAEVQADTIGLYLVTRSGYSPQASVDFFDRIAETKGKTGGFWSDLLGETSSDSKRLRAMIKSATPMPADCVQPRVGAGANFSAWQQSVVEFTPLRNAENLPGLISKRALTNRLTPTLNSLRISPDGKYVLAQDESGVFVLTRQPLKSLFHIIAWDASPAMFTPDSQNIVFDIGGFRESPRVEKWNIDSQKRVEVHEIYIAKGCIVRALSPDGKTLACIVDASSESELRMDFDLYDTAAGTSYYHMNKWAAQDFFSYEQSLGLYNLLTTGDKTITSRLPIRFSPDSRYLVARGPSKDMCFDLSQRAPLPLSAGVKSLLQESSRFAFVGNNQFIGIKDSHSGKARLVKFPSGEKVADDITVGSATLTPIAQGDFVLISPLKDSSVGVLDLKKNIIALACKRDAADVWNNAFVAELLDGSLQSFELATGKAGDKVQLPQAPIAKLTAGEVSSDLAWLALSQKTRGGVWNLRTGQQIYKVLGFQGAYFDSGDAVYADFYKPLNAKRTIVQMTLPSVHLEQKQELDEKNQVSQYGRYLLEFVPDKDSVWHDKNVTIEVHDVRDNRLLWSKHFDQERPNGWITAKSHTLVLYWPAGSKAIKSVARQDPDADAKLKPYQDKQGIIFLQLLDLESGKIQSQLAIDTGKNSFVAKDIAVAGNRVVLFDDQNRVMLYSLDGKRQATFPGRGYIISDDALLVEEESPAEKLALYDLSSSEKRAQYTFESPVILSEFSGDGKRLLVVTADQTVYILDPKVARDTIKVTAR